LGWGPNAGVEFLTGFLIEKALSIDNMFVFVVIFRYFAVPPELQHRVLFYGILGAMIMRGIFIGLGTVLIANFHAILYIFGFFLVYTGYKLWKEKDEEYEVERNRVVVWGRKNLPLTDAYIGQRFFVRRGNRLMVTPLFLVLLTIEFTDLVFAIDSIPAIFVITQDSFIVFTSNMFAIAGLRALYFVLAGVVDRFHYLQQGLALVLAFVGSKMLLADVYHHFRGEEFPIVVSLIVVLSLIVGSVVLSLLRPKPAVESPKEEPFEPGPPV
jgi:tellurite resistance protein TerC